MLRGVNDRIGVDGVSAVKIGDVAGLAKAVDAERDDRVAGEGAEPRRGRWVKVTDGDERPPERRRANSRSATPLSLRARADCQSRCSRSGEATARGRLPG